MVKQFELKCFKCVSASGFGVFWSGLFNKAKGYEKWLLTTSKLKLV